MVFTEKTGKSLRQLPIADVLHQLTVWQRTPRDGESLPLAPETAEGLFAWFQATLQTRRVAAFNREGVRGKFAAGAHHTLSFAFLTAFIERQGDSCTLLSPQKTLALYECLSPGARRVNRPFKSDSLDIIAVPDGVLVNREKKVVALCEYSLSENTGHFKHKLEAFQKVKGWYPNLFADRSFLLMVVPKDLGLARFQQAEVEFRKVPYTKQQVMEFTDSLLAKLASREDVRARMVHQAKEYRRLVREGKVTPPWRDWARKHEPLIRNVKHP